MPRSLSTLLIANRGEIAVRIIRACREEGIRAVAVASEADRDALHARLADEVHFLGPGPAAESYLHVKRILDAARAAGADAIHPGYGFLSENAEFAEACESAGFTFVGPPAPVIRLLGDKIRAKQLMEKAGVPVVPGWTGEEQSPDRLRAEAERIGAPLLIKAAAGGGGRGMRVVRDMAAFAGELEEAKREAKTAFGDDRVLLERYVERPRHIEVQVFGDAHGNVVHLYERECSIQRRHQKIIEESPSPALTAAARARITEAAVTAARAAGYVNAGTVEFLFEEDGADGRFYFLEVNTRLQVEHPVTETLIGRDLVKLQLRVARGEPLGFTQEEVLASGHALECRIYAEDPETGFLPSVGPLLTWAEPAGPWIRVDSGVAQGAEVSPFYDPMLAKLIVRGEDREEANHRMAAALREFHVLGVRTNIGYLLDVLDRPAYRAGALSTGFLAEQFGRWKPSNQIPPEVFLALAAETLAPRARTTALTATQGGAGPWRLANGWRNAATASREQGRP
jgi:3-methylcrotonyl-CoA carboxylase alpha subunit